MNANEIMKLTKWDILKSHVYIEVGIDADELWDFLIIEAEKFLALLRKEIDTDETAAEFVVRKFKRDDPWAFSRMESFMKKQKQI